MEARQFNRRCLRLSGDGDLQTRGHEDGHARPAIGSEIEQALVELGFRQGPRRLTLRA